MINPFLLRRAAATDDESKSLNLILNHVQNEFGGADIHVYEAGGAIKPITSGWFANAQTTVVDLECGHVAAVAERIVFVQGDIREYFPNDKAFDLIVCHYVLEHVPRPEEALEKFCLLTKPGGLIFIASPCFWSLNAVAAKLTPFWFHVWFYRRILGKKNAGKNGKAPFRTYHSKLIEAGCLIDFFQQRGFDVIHTRKFINRNYQILIERRPLIATVLELWINAMNLACRHKYDFGEGDFHLVLRRRVT